MYTIPELFRSEECSDNLYSTPLHNHLNKINEECSFPLNILEILKNCFIDIT